MTQLELKPGTYVTDTSASNRYDTAVYRVVKHLFERTEVELVGTVQNGRLGNFPRDRQVTHRTTTNLRPWSRDPMTTQIQLRLNDEIVNRLRELATREKRSLTNMCLVILEEALPAYEAVAGITAKAKAGKA